MAGAAIGANLPGGKRRQSKPLRKYRVAVFVETSRGYGRSLCEGIADFAQSVGTWAFEGGGEAWETGVRGLRGRVDGVIARIPNPRMAKALSDLRVPVVDLYRWRTYPSISSVDGDHVAIGQLAADWFVERRFRHFAFCGYTGAPFSDLREKGFSERLAPRGFACSVYRQTLYDASYLGRMILQAESYGEPPDRDRLVAWLAALPRPTALFCCHDIRAYQVIALCKELGLSVPHDVAVMGVDNDRILCGFSNPMLTSVDPDAYRIGWTGARWLAERMARRTIPVRHGGVPPLRVVERASTECDPVEPQWLSETLRFIRKGICDGVNADEVIRHTGLSHTLVGKTFSRVLGCTVHQEIARLRMREACRLLTETDSPVVKVGRLAGFSSPQYFSRLFRAEFRLTPLEYRLRHLRS